MSDVSPDLGKPPIIEVVCGFVFESVPNFDPLEMGVFWNTRRDEYPYRQMHPVLSDGPVFQLGAAPMRAWLISEDESYLVQLQHDRCYVNWRASDEQYPRFHDHDGSEGVLTRSLREHTTLMQFFEEEFEKAPQIKRVELTKINHLRIEHHWGSLDELKTLIPVLDVLSIGALDFNLAWVNTYDVGRVVTTLKTAQLKEESVVRLEHRFIGEIGNSDAAALLRTGNDLLNEVFCSIFSDKGWEKFEPRGERPC